MAKKQPQQLIIYKDKQGQLEVKLEADTVWLTLTQMAQLFGRDKSVISRHIAAVYTDKELVRKATVAKYATVQKEGGRPTTRYLEYYNLDAIISVGYRVKSKQGVQFRIWANKILKEYLVKGFAVNERRLKDDALKLQELKKMILLQEKVFSEHALQQTEAEGLLRVISEYMQALDVLDDYDHQRLQLPKYAGKITRKISYTEAKRAIHKLGAQTSASTLFGREKDDSFKGSLENIYQTFDSVELYPSTEEKAAHLLYFVVKNHSFADGNKRIAAFLFVWFLEQNKLLYDDKRSKAIGRQCPCSLNINDSRKQSE